MTNRTVLLVIAVVAIVGGIYFLNSLNVERGASAPAEDIKVEDLGAATTTSANTQSATTTSDDKSLVTPKKAPADTALSAGRTERVATKQKKFERAKEITTPDGFVNTGPFALKDFIGDKVILIDFWTYSCINCQRTFPYLRAWYEKYKDHGLVIVGLHTPEFAFERDLANVKTAAAKFGLTYPIVLDNDYSTWSAYKNQYWPREYLIDADGFIVHDHIGEGGYAETEKAIVEALNERKRLRGEKEIVFTAAKPLGAIAPSSGVTPETYLGWGRRDDTIFANKISPACDGTACDYKAPETLLAGKYSLMGSWQTDQDSIESKSSASITMKVRTKMMYLVAQAKSGTIPVTVVVDGKVTKTIDVSNSTLYDVAAFAGVEDHTIELRAEKPGLVIFTFTFG